MVANGSVKGKAGGGGTAFPDDEAIGIDEGDCGGRPAGGDGAYEAIGGADEVFVVALVAVRHPDVIGERVGRGGAAGYFAGGGGEDFAEEGGAPDPVCFLGLEAEFGKVLGGGEDVPLEGGGGDFLDDPFHFPGRDFEKVGVAGNEGFPGAVGVFGEVETWDGGRRTTDGRGFSRIGFL